jgi:hypothetical protein
MKINKPFSRFGVSVGVTSSLGDTKESVFAFTGCYLCDYTTITKQGKMTIQTVFLLDNDYFLIVFEHYINDSSLNISQYFTVLASVDQMITAGIPRQLVTRVRKVLAAIND